MGYFSNAQIVSDPRDRSRRISVRTRERQVQVGYVRVCSLQRATPAIHCRWLERDLSKHIKDGLEVLRTTMSRFTIFRVENDVRSCLKSADIVL
jgi:hypothetical protein